MSLFGPEPMSTAIVSACGLFRYRLTRTWDPGKQSACFLMLNPSTADATKDDATIRRCISFAKSWNCGGITVVNLFAFRSRHPKAMAAAVDPVGPENDLHIRDVVEQSYPIVVAWGGGVPKAYAARVEAVRAILANVGVSVFCLGRTDGGQPRHPLMLRSDTKLEAYWKTIATKESQ